MFDNPELLARKIRQATQGDSSARAASKQPRAVHFQEPLSGQDGPDAMEEDEDSMQEVAREEEEQAVADTPHHGPTHSVELADSELRLSLSKSAAQQSNAGERQEEGEEEEGETWTGRDSAQIQALHAAASSEDRPANTTGKVLATSKDSLQKALDIAQGMLASDAPPPPAAADVSAAIDDAGQIVSSVNHGAQAPNLPAKSAENGARPHDSALQSAGAAANGAKEAVQAVASEQSGGNDGSSASLPRAQSSAQEVAPDSSVLASTTRPNVPRKLGANLAHLKAASSPAFKVAHAGHTPHPNKSRMMPSDHLEATPQGSAVVRRGVRVGQTEHNGATPAATLRPFDLSTEPAPSSTTAGGMPYPSTIGAPIEDTPMTRIGPAVMSELVPDSCVGQVCASCVALSNTPVRLKLLVTDMSRQGVLKKMYVCIGQCVSPYASKQTCLMLLMYNVLSGVSAVYACHQIALLTGSFAHCLCAFSLLYTLQVASGRINQSIQSVAKRSPQSHPIHLSTIEEDDVEMAEQSIGSDLQNPLDGTAHTGEGTVAVPGSQDVEPRLPLPEDVQQAAALQVSCMYD